MFLKGENMNKEFKVGSLVNVKGFAQTMIIERIRFDKFASKEADCFWFNKNGKNKTHSFPIETLELINNGD
jgi:uncharacterized protein YodC (DUF2158 family)